MSANSPQRSATSGEHTRPALDPRTLVEEISVPHINVKHFPQDFSDDQEQRLAQALTAVVVEQFEVPDGAVSIALEAVERDDWDDAVVAPEITGRGELLIKHPDYC